MKAMLSRSVWRPLLAVSVGLVVLAIASGAHFVTFNSASNPSLNERTITHLRLDAEAFVKKLKAQETPEGRTAIILDMCWLHQEIVKHSMFEQSPQLQNVRSLVGNQLKSFLKELQRANRKQQTAGGNDRQKVDSSTAQGASGGSGYSSTFDESQLENWSAYNHYRTGLSFGGATNFLGHLNGNFAPPWDHGEDLVQLIESTINREFWQRNGGEGRIHYYQPSRVLVVGATIDIQDSIGNLLRHLR